jgi:uracil-DNA glycosylase family 4
MPSLDDLAGFYGRVRGWRGCDSLRLGAAQAVLADGNPAAQVWVVGEAPGAEEDRVGKPFVGRSGKRLDALLAEAGLARHSNVYITNAVFWRPPNNRPPTVAEIAACRPWLEEHVALLRPALLILVGATAVRAVMGPAAFPQGPAMRALRGRLHPLVLGGVGVQVLVTYHPAYVLRNPAAAALVREDLALVPDTLKLPR